MWSWWLQDCSSGPEKSQRMLRSSFVPSLACKWQSQNSHRGFSRSGEVIHVVSWHVIVWTCICWCPRGPTRYRSQCESSDLCPCTVANVQSVSLSVYSVKGGFSLTVFCFSSHINSVRNITSLCLVPSVTWLWQRAFQAGNSRQEKQDKYEFLRLCSD